jgi:hypothetical protein
MKKYSRYFFFSIFISNEIFFKRERWTFRERGPNSIFCADRSQLAMQMHLLDTADDGVAEGEGNDGKLSLRRFEQNQLFCGIESSRRGTMEGIRDVGGILMLLFVTYQKS